MQIYVVTPLNIYVKYSQTGLYLETQILKITNKCTIQAILTCKGKDITMIMYFKKGNIESFIENCVPGTHGFTH